MTPMIDWREHLVWDPAICHGALYVEGSRVPVTVILDNLAEGAERPERLGSPLRDVQH